MMVLPLLFLFVMPKLLANADPETQKVCTSFSSFFICFYWNITFSSGEKLCEGNRPISQLNLVQGN